MTIKEKETASEASPSTKLPPELPSPLAEMQSLLQKALAGIPHSVSVSGDELEAVFDRSSILAACRSAKEDPNLNFDYLRSLCGLEEDDDFRIVYHLYSTTRHHKVVFKTALPKSEAKVDSVTPVWRGADWHERETAELFGIRFSGHPHPLPLLLEEGLDEHPLRKDHPLVPIGADRPQPEPSPEVEQPSSEATKNESETG